MGAELAVLHGKAVFPAAGHEALVQGNGNLRPGRSGEAGAAAFAVGKQGELAHHQQ